ncbi:MAG: hypothetical protein U0414_14675 [Polyangiaceae bacterium]
MRAFVAAIAALALGGCTPYFFAVTDPPPAHQGRFAGTDDKGVEQIVLSKGVALAIECREPWLGEPCAYTSATSANPQIAAVLPSHLSEVKDPMPYRYYGPAYNPQPRAGFVVAGVSPGETTITVASADGDRVFRVIVASR